MLRLILATAIVLAATVAQAQQDPATPQAPAREPAMTVQRMGQIIRALDEEAQLRGPTISFTIADVPVIVIADPLADRMRAMVPIRAADGLDAEELMRLMQANFDSALDARYAVARGRLWGVFIHPLSPLETKQLISGLAQTVNVARSYGQTYSGGASVFGGGDSNGIYQDLLKELQDKGQEL